MCTEEMGLSSWSSTAVTGSDSRSRLVAGQELRRTRSAGCPSSAEHANLLSQECGTMSLRVVVKGVGADKSRYLPERSAIGTVSRDDGI